MALAVSVLKQQIEQAKESLKSVDDNIKKVTGRDPNESRFDRGRGSRDSARLGRRRPTGNDDHDSAEPPAKRAGGLFRRGPPGALVGRRVIVGGRRTSQKRQSDDDDDDDVTIKPSVQSSVVSTEKKITKNQIINAQNVDEKGKARNRRMFGMLMGTLVRFQSEESKANLAMKQEKRRSEIERRLEEAQALDRRRMVAERRELFSERRSKQQKINLLEEKVELSGEFEEWEKEWSKKGNFLITKTEPRVFFLPKDSTGRTIRALKETQQFIKDKICEGKSSLEQTLKEIDRDIAALAGDGKTGEGEGKKEVGKVEEVDDLMEEPAGDINVEMEERKEEEGSGDEEAMSENSGSSPREEGVRQGEREVIPGKEGATPGEVGAMTGKEEATPGEGEAVPGKEGATPGEGEAAPVKGGAISEEGGAMPEKEGATLTESGGTSGEEEEAPGNESVVHGEGTGAVGSASPGSKGFKVEQQGDGEVRTHDVAGEAPPNGKLTDHKEANHDPTEERKINAEEDPEAETEKEVQDTNAKKVYTEDEEKKDPKTKTTSRPERKQNSEARRRRRDTSPKRSQSRRSSSHSKKAPTKRRRHSPEKRRSPVRKRSHERRTRRRSSSSSGSSSESDGSRSHRRAHSSSSSSTFSSSSSSTPSPRSHRSDPKQSRGSASRRR